MRRLALAWGVQALAAAVGTSVDEMIRNGDRMLVRAARLKPGDRVVLVAGTSLTSGATNLMKIHRIGESLTGRRAR